MVLLWEDKFGNVSLSRSSILSSGLPSTSKFGHSFRLESVGEMLGAMVLPWDCRFGQNFSPATGGDASLTAGPSSGEIIGYLSLASGEGSTTGGAVSVSGVTGTIGLGCGITRSGALLLKTFSAGTSGVSGSVTMRTGYASSGSSGIVMFPVVSAVFSTGGSITVLVGSGYNGGVPLEYPEGGGTGDL